MEFQSILFKKEKKVQDTPPGCFRDLNLDTIIENITMGKSTYRLKPFFYTPLNDTEEVEYRQRIIRDLMENKGLTDTIREFSYGMSMVRRYIEQGEKLTHPLQKKRWFLDAVDIYCDTISLLEKGCEISPPKSPGLTSFQLYIKKYTDSPDFKRLVKETKGLKERLSSVRYTIWIKGNRVRVKKYSREPNYTEEIEKTFERFRKGKVKDYTLTFYDSLQMNHVEEKILELVAKLYSDVFSELDTYCEKNKDFMDKKIARFDREIQFYISYLDYMKILNTQGLSFTIPKVNEEGETSVVKGFDMALAYKLKIEGKKPVVCNDFYLKGSERIFIVTGPNQGGKTTFARMFGQIHYFASLGLPVPGERAEVTLVDNIFTHFEREEDIRDLRGKLEDDLVRIREILKLSTEKSIIIMNEIFSSTTLEDAYTLGKMVIHKILEIGAKGVMVTFLDELSLIDKRVVSMVGLVDPQNPTIRTYKIVRKRADGLSYAMALAVKYGLTYDAIKERLRG